MAQGYRKQDPSNCQERGHAVPTGRYASPMKSLIAIVVLAIAGVVIYKVLTAEVPIDGS